jgi:lipoprotein-anchoring transpeptidase ErfK/SrfK
LIVSLATQRAVLYRNGVPIGISIVSTGRSGYRTPTGIFTILQRKVEHHSGFSGAESGRIRIGDTVAIFAQGQSACAQRRAPA